MSDELVVAGEKVGSRLILGTGGAPSLQVIDEVIGASGTASVRSRCAGSTRRPPAPSSTC